jgi:hypothetical protein
MRTTLFVLLAAVAACTHLEVLDLGGGKYSVTGAAHFRGVASAREDAVEAAKAYCAARGQVAIIDTLDDKALSPFSGASSSAVFKCVPAQH